jgi:hypothetical protein
MKLMEITSHQIGILNSEEFTDLFTKYFSVAKDIGFKNIFEMKSFILECIIEEDSLVLACVNTKNIPLGYIICRIEFRPRLGIKECVIWQAVSILDKTISRLVLGYIERWARKKGCGIIRANSSRCGMERFLRKHGFKMKFVVFEKIIKEDLK